MSFLLLHSGLPSSHLFHERQHYTCIHYYTLNNTLFLQFAVYVYPLTLYQSHSAISASRSDSKGSMHVGNINTGVPKNNGRQKVSM